MDDGVLEKWTSRIEAGLRKVINRHGHAFHYAVLKRAGELFEENQSPWLFQASEFPVATKGRSTKIDFVLEHKSSSKYLVGECKRANPAYLNWCFLKAPMTRRNPGRGQVLVEKVTVEDENGVYAGKDVLTYEGVDPFGLGIELKTGERGDPGGPGKGAIDEALGQVLLGVSGLVNFLAGHRDLLTQGQSTQIVPAIFTTARLWTSDVDISNASVQSGELEEEALDPRPVGWMWLRYHSSPELRHSVPLQGGRPGLAAALDLEYARAVAVVGPDGIDDFLRREW